MRTALIILSILLIGITPSFGFDHTDSLNTKAVIQEAVKKILLQDKQNRINEKRGLASQNNYVIDIDTKNWIEEQGSAEKILKEEDFKSMSQNLQAFNNRKDGLRFYVIVINDYVVKFETQIDPVLVGETFKWNDLQKYTHQQEVVKGIWNKTNNLITGISTALESKGFPERMIYFYSQLKVEEYDEKTHLYKFDRLNFIGKAIEPLQDNIRKRVIVQANSAVRNIGQAVSSIINSAKAVIDGDDNSPAIDCSQSIETIAEHTKSIRGKEYDKQVSDFAALIDNPSSAQQKGSRYVIIDQPDNISSDNIFSQEILPDKVALLAQSGNSEYKLYVVFKEISFVMPSGDWEAFAQSVGEKSTIAKQSNTILMVVPYFKTICTGSNWLGMTVGKGTGITMAAVYTSTNLKGAMNSALSASGTSWAKTFDDAYSQIPKKYKTYDYKFLWNGDLINDSFNDHGTITGKANIVEVRILEDARFSQLKDAWSEYMLGATGVGASSASGGGYTMNISSQQFDQLAALADTYSKRVDEILGKRPQFFYVTKTNLVESKLSETVANDFTFWYAKHKKLGFVSYFSSPENEIFYGGKNPEKVQDALTLIDIGSGITSFVGADAIFDGLGAYYAYSNGEYREAAFYAAATSVPFWSGAVRRAVMEGGTYVLKTAKGSFVTMPKGVLGMNYLFNIEDAFSAFMKTALDLKTYSKAAKYKTETKFLEALEDGMIADVSAIKKLNDNPDLIDEFNTFYKDGKGGLKEFLAKGNGWLSKFDDLGLDALKKEINLIDETFKTKFIDEFAGASDDALRAMNENTSLLEYWKSNGDFIKNRAYPNVGHKSWDETRNAIVTKADATETKILNAIEIATPPSNSQVALAGAYSTEITGDVIIRYNDKNFNVNLLEPELKQYIDYLSLIKNDFDKGGKLYEKLYTNVPFEKLQNAGEVGKHAEVLATNEVIKLLKANGSFNSIQDLDKIHVLVKGRSSFGNMCRCPHCFQILEGVKMIGNQ